MSKKELRRAWSVDDILKKSYKTFQFSDEWYQAFGSPETTGLWFIWGDSGSGKTSFVLKFIKELTRFERVVVNDLEEAAAHTVQEAFKRNDMGKAAKRLTWVSETMEEFDKRLSLFKSQNVAVINSYQYTMMSFKQFLEFKRKHSAKLIIVVSQADGKQPAGRAAKSVMFDAGLKIWVEGHKAFSKGRYIGPNGGTYVIWKEGAELYHGTDK